MPVTRITIYSGPAPRPKPKVGDRRTTKKHGVQIRIFERCRYGHLVDSRGRSRYEWVGIADLPDEYRYLLTTEEKALKAFLRPGQIAQPDVL